MSTGLEDIVALSHEYGGDPAWVVAGGGNTSFKDESTLYVKASGFALASIGEDGFARMDRGKLAQIWENEYPQGESPEEVAERERLVLADMMDARMPGEERRPSVETQLHDLLPWPLIVHLHPTLVNGLTCGAAGRQIAAELFGDSQVWIPVTDPGYVLAVVIREELAKRTAAGKQAPDYIFLANHGVFVGGHTPDEIRERYSRLDAVLRQKAARTPEVSLTIQELGDTPESTDPSALQDIARSFFGEEAAACFVTGSELSRYLSGAADGGALTGCLTPDHIVYAGPGALALTTSGGSIADAWNTQGKAYQNTWGKPANVILLPDSGGAIVAAANKGKLDRATLLLENALEVAGWAESFGGAITLEERFVRFIVDWEVENYRSKQG